MRDAFPLAVVSVDWLENALLPQSLRFKSFSISQRMRGVGSIPAISRKPLVQKGEDLAKRNAHATVAMHLNSVGVPHNG